MANPQMPESSPPDAPGATTAAPAVPPPSFVKLAMRNMVRKGRQSLLHFGLTAVGLLGFLVFLAWLGRPIQPH
jgi:hypothetical protein